MEEIQRNGWRQPDAFTTDRYIFSSKLLHERQKFVQLTIKLVNMQCSADRIDSHNGDPIGLSGVD